MCALQLTDGFRYTYRPVVSDASFAWLGHDAEVAALRERITHSDGGTFLVAGFRGVGKTTVVNRALQQLTVPDAAGRVLVPVYINVARPIRPEQLLFAVIRRTVDTLTDQGLLDRMPTSALRQLLLAYARTSMSLTRHDERSHQHSRDLSIGGASGSAGAQFILNSLLPKLELGSTDSRSLAVEASFLGYSDTDVEHDFLRVAALLKSADPPAAPTNGARSRFRRRRRGPAADPAPVVARPAGLVVVFDELDKLTAAPGGAEALEEILGSLKNILTCDGVHVILVGGPDLHDRVLLDAEDGDGLYEDVIGWQLYVPCLWDCADRLLESALPAPAAGASPAAGAGIAAAGTGSAKSSPEGESSPAADRAALLGFLRFMARGLPRRVFQEFGSLVVFDAGRPRLALTEADRLRIAVYHEVEQVVSEFLGEVDVQRHLTMDEDRFRTAVYRLCGRILRGEGGVFSARVLMHARTDGDRPSPSIYNYRHAPIALESVEVLLRLMAENGLLEVFRGVNRTVYSDSSLPPDDYYQLSVTLREKLVRIARSSERERARLFGPGPGEPAEPSSQAGPARPPGSALNGSPAPAGWSTTYAWDTTYDGGATGPSSFPRSPFQAREEWLRPAGQSAGIAALEHPIPPTQRFIAHGRYELLEVIGIGGMSRVYRARDSRTDTEVAIKILDRQQSFRGQSRQEMRERFQREAEVGKSLQIPGVARTLDGPIVERDGRLAIVQQLMPGPTLQAAVEQSGPFPPQRAARIAQQLAHSLAQIHAAGVLRVDLKPSNIILGTDDLPGIVDFGIARSEHFEAEITRAGTLVGTPMYMAPELLNRGEPTATADVYALGVVICFMLTGRTPWPEPFGRARFEEPDLSELPGSEQLRQVVREALRADPAERIALAADLEAVLLGTPELEQLAPAEDEEGEQGEEG